MGVSPAIHRFLKLHPVGLTPAAYSILTELWPTFTGIGFCREFRKTASVTRSAAGAPVICRTITITRFFVVPGAPQPVSNQNEYLKKV